MLLQGLLPSSGNSIAVNNTTTTTTTTTATTTSTTSSSTSTNNNNVAEIMNYDYFGKINKNLKTFVWLLCSGADVFFM